LLAVDPSNLGATLDFASQVTAIAATSFSIKFTAGSLITQTGIVNVQTTLNSATQSIYVVAPLAQVANTSIVCTDTIIARDTTTSCTITPKAVSGNALIAVYIRKAQLTPVITTTGSHGATLSNTTPNYGTILALNLYTFTFNAGLSVQFSTGPIVVSDGISSPVTATTLTIYVYDVADELDFSCSESGTNVVADGVDRFVVVVGVQVSCSFIPRKQGFAIYIRPSQFPSNTPLTLSLASGDNGDLGSVGPISPTFNSLIPSNSFTFTYFTPSPASSTVAGFATRVVQITHTPTAVETDPLSLQLIQNPDTTSTLTCQNARLRLSSSMTCTFTAKNNSFIIGTWNNRIVPLSSVANIVTLSAVTPTFGSAFTFTVQAGSTISSIVISITGLSSVSFSIQVTDAVIPPNQPNPPAVTFSSALALLVNWTLSSNPIENVPISTKRVERTTISPPPANPPSSAQGLTFSTFYSGAANTPLTQNENNIVANTMYCYRVIDINSAGESFPSTLSCITTDTVPPQVSGLTISETFTGGHKLNSTWNAIAAFKNSFVLPTYELRYKRSVDTQFTLFQSTSSLTLAAPVQLATDSNPVFVRGIRYDFRVDVVNVYATANGSVVSYTLSDVPGAPTISVAVGESSNSIILQWIAGLSNGQAISSYELQRKPTNDSNASFESIVTQSGQSYLDTGLSETVLF